MKKINILLISIVIVLTGCNSANVLFTDQKIEDSYGIVVFDISSLVTFGSDSPVEGKTSQVWFKNISQDASFDLKKNIYKIGNLGQIPKYLYLPEGEYLLIYYEYQTRIHFNWDLSKNPNFLYTFKVERGKVNYIGNYIMSLNEVQTKYYKQIDISVRLIKFDVVDKYTEELEMFKSKYPKFANLPSVNNTGRLIKDVIKEYKKNSK